MERVTADEGRGVEDKRLNITGFANASWRITDRAEPASSQLPVATVPLQRRARPQRLPVARVLEIS